MIPNVSITIITVSFNSQLTIEDTLISIDSQNHKEIEHIIIDGGSTDETMSVVNRYGNTWRHAFSESDNGIYDAMNKGLSLATGEVIGFLNSDDLFENDSVLKTVSSAFMDFSIDIVYGDLHYVTKDNSKVIRSWRSGISDPIRFEHAWAPPHPCFFVRRSAVMKYGEFDTSLYLAADNEFMMRYLQIHRLKYIYIPEVFVRMRVGGASNKSLVNICRQNIEIRRSFKKHEIKYNTFYFLISKLFVRIFQFATARRF
jgi:glycosyltransferase involved in cell wall biosynthesis